MKRLLLIGMLGFVCLVLVAAVIVEAVAYFDVSDKLDDTKAELATALAQLEDAWVEGIDFQNGLVVSEVVSTQHDDVQGKVENVSDDLMPRVAILVAFYQEDGSLAGVRYTDVHDLHPDEELAWEVRHPNPWDYVSGGGSFAIYAVGSK